MNMLISKLFLYNSKLHVNEIQNILKKTFNFFLF